MTLFHITNKADICFLKIPCVLKIFFKTKAPQKQSCDRRYYVNWGTRVLLSGARVKKKKKKRKIKLSVKTKRKLSLSW